MTLDSFFPSDRDNSEITMNNFSTNNPSKSDESDGAKMSELYDERNHPWAVLNPEDGMYYVTKAWLVENARHLHKLMFARYVTPDGKPRGFSLDDGVVRKAVDTKQPAKTKCLQNDEIEKNVLVSRICRKCGAQREIPISQTHCGFLGCDSTKLIDGHDEEKYVMNGIGANGIVLEGNDDANLIGRSIQRLLQAAEDQDVGTLPMYEKACNFNCTPHVNWIDGEVVMRMPTKDGEVTIPVRVAVDGPNKDCNHAMKGIPHDGYAYKPLVMGDGSIKMNRITGEPIYVKDMEVDWEAAILQSRPTESIRLWREKNARGKKFMEDLESEKEPVDWSFVKAASALKAYQPQVEEPLYKDTAGVWKVETWKKKFGDEVPYPQKMSYKEVSLCLMVINSHNHPTKTAFGLIDKSLRDQEAHDEAIELLKNDTRFMSKTGNTAAYNSEMKQLDRGYKPSTVMPARKDYKAYNPETDIQKMEQFLEMQEQEKFGSDCHNMTAHSVFIENPDDKWKFCDYKVKSFIDKKTGEEVKYADVKSWKRMMMQAIKSTYIPETTDELHFNAVEPRVVEIEAPEVTIIPKDNYGYPEFLRQEFVVSGEAPKAAWTQIQDILMDYHQKEQTDTYYCFICSKRHSKVICH